MLPLPSRLVVVWIRFSVVVNKKSRGATVTSELPNKTPTRTLTTDYDPTNDHVGQNMMRVLSHRENRLTMPPLEEASVNYLYREKSAPCFLWTLALAPCLCPVVWYARINVAQ